MPALMVEPTEKPKKKDEGELCIVQTEMVPKKSSQFSFEYAKWSKKIKNLSKGKIIPVKVEELLKKEQPELVKKDGSKQEPKEEKKIMLSILSNLKINWSNEYQMKLFMGLLFLYNLLPGIKSYNFRENLSDDFIANVRDYYNRAKTLAKNLGIKEADDEVYLNLAFGIYTIGEEKVTYLHQKTGMEFFGRYTKVTLENLCDNLKLLEEGTNQKPIFLYAVNKSDWNGAFYKRPRNFEALHQKYSVIIIETNSEDDFIGRLDNLKNLSKGRFSIDILMIGGHGSVDEVRLGPEDEEKSFLDLTDADVINELLVYVKTKMMIILESCSTGAGADSIGAFISKKIDDSTVIAPTTMTRLIEFVFNEKGEVIAAAYDVPSHVFKNGLVTKDIP